MIKTLHYENDRYKIWRIPVQEKAAKNENVKRLRDEDLSDEQRARYFELTCWLDDDSKDKDYLRTLGGYAGTGKTTLISHLAKHYDGKRRIVYAAYTGKATNLLRARLRAHGVYGDVMTLHSLLYKAVQDEKTGRVISWEPKVGLDDMYDLIVVDEASMVDEAMFGDLLKMGVPILAVGDHGQLPPVSGDFNLMESPQLRLEHIHRQAESSPIIALSKHVRQTGKLPPSWTYEGQDVQIVSRRELRAVLESIYSIPDIDPLEVGLLAFSNRMRGEMNRTAKDIWWSKASPTPLRKEEPRMGDSVICLRNIARMVFNGMRGKLIRWADTSRLHATGEVEFPDEGLTIEGTFCKAQFGRPSTFKDFEEYEEATNVRIFKWADMGLLFDFGYALTVHKSQGSGFKYVVLYDDVPYHVEPDVYRRWLYTGITRCSSHLVILR